MKKTTITKRRELIKAATPNILKELFEMQNHKCDLCGEYIQDLVLAALDHSTPVILFARGRLPIKKAIKLANDPANLRATHSSCNGAKGAMTREEWFIKGMDKKVGKHRLFTLQEIAEHKKHLIEIARKGGLIGGRKNAKSGQIHALGRWAVESGHLERISSQEARSRGGYNQPSEIQKRNGFLSKKKVLVSLRRELQKEVDSSRAVRTL
jgi:hypothetical protein